MKSDEIDAIIEKADLGRFVSQENHGPIDTRGMLRAVAEAACEACQERYEGKARRDFAREVYSRHCEMDGDEFEEWLFRGQAWEGEK